MVIDGAKGVEAQTKKLFKVCTLRHIPIFTFVNKLDHEARDPVELMEEIENVLGINTYPMNWPSAVSYTHLDVYKRQMLTPALINLGWRGGHFFPVIFSGVSVGLSLIHISMRTICKSRLSAAQKSGRHRDCCSTLPTRQDVYKRQVEDRAPAASGRSRARGCLCHAQSVSP